MSEPSNFSINESLREAITLLCNVRAYLILSSSNNSGVITQITEFVKTTKEKECQRMLKILGDEVKPEPKAKAEYFCLRCKETFSMEGLSQKVICPNCEDKEVLWKVS